MFRTASRSAAKGVRRAVAARRLVGAATAAVRSTASAAPSRSMSTGAKKAEGKRMHINHDAAVPETGMAVEQYFGINVFDRNTLEASVPAAAFKSYLDSIENAKPITNDAAEAVAAALLKWAQARGCTHYTHWFQPLTGTPAEKHDTFLDLNRKGEALSRFTAKQLIRGEPDGSSFPSGGLRSTHTARGYTAWDPTSAPFVLENGNGSTLYIPALFYSWESGIALDDKIPLLRSAQALRRESLRLFEVLGEKENKSVHCDSGLEQEFFLVDRDLYLARSDLLLAGRTLVGNVPPKGQQMEDQYFAYLSRRSLDCIHDFEIAMWKLGVPIQTRHREVAPGQYEVAPRFAESNIATDRNLIMMEVLRTVARKHGLAALLHEKPFAGVNGSGKHNNWSFGTNITPSLLDPGNNPETNSRFMLFLAATTRALDHHGDLLRVSMSGAGNDHRLGANEAPPAIVSAYLGDDISQAVDKFLAGDKSPSKVELKVDLGVPYLPTVIRAGTDRNRTSTFAFTGNKFEFRAVGSSHNPSRSNMVLNTILADSIKHVTEEIAGALKSGKSKDAAIESVARATLNKHKHVIFNGNNYSEEWVKEAAKRGLPNLRNTPAALATLLSEKNFKLFQATKVLTKPELEARSSIYYEDYNKKLAIEGKVLVNLVSNEIVPAAINYQTRVAASLAALKAAGGDSSTQKALLDAVSSHVDKAIAGAKQIKAHLHKAHEIGGDKGLAAEAEFLRDSLIPAMLDTRAAADKLETLVPSEEWPLPTYQELLFGEPH